ncbi:oxalyl-CoA decarboxylase [Adlercreutzia sp. R25]|uniref:Oxalyl-CoA decarboxylase n=1 Tax=Adlercreutzia shanghongiae TaxID=3111773 RepID=A0ABU6IZ15_9ACTN|nr:MULTISPECIES: oxalyl-CoA decarboxylase [unclassified Adlercreutzia]MEC4272800.1 oxalyl-CoA decarboxylase [Adlercreutzia sp. R25]MEC4295086.1 oxalyl-CoA decarboxylase [Adlercreutzia sp. R22]
MATTTQAAPAAQTDLTDGFHVLADALLKNHFERMYGVIGIPVTDVARIAQAKGMRYIGLRHESDAGNAAAAEGFITGKPGLYLTVSAPGFLNGIVPLKEATENGWPVIMMSGSSSRELIDMGEGDYEGTDQLNYAKPFAKAAYRVDKVEDIPLVVARAIRAACSGRPGGVYIDLPGDTLGQTIAKDAAEALLYEVNDPAPAQIPAQSVVDQAMEVLASAKKPLIYLGKGAAYAQCDEAVKQFVESTGAPYLAMSMAKGLLPDNHPQNAASARGMTMRNADVVVLLGARLNWMLNFGKGRAWNENVKFIQVDIDPTEIDNSRYIAAPVVGDLKSTIGMFNEYLAKKPYKADPAWLESIQADSAKNNARFGGAETATTVPMTHYNALGAIKKVTDANPDVYIANEGANALDDCRDIIDMYLPRHRLDCGTWGVMGVGLPYAIGAAVTTGKPVISIHGDSAFGFDGMEVETICRYQLPVTVVVLNNGGIYRGDFKNLGDDGDPSPLTLSACAHYEKLMEAFGGTGYYATTPAEVEKYVAEGVASGKPTMVCVELSIHSGKESGHITYLNPQPVTGPLVGNEQEDLAEHRENGKLVD